MRTIVILAACILVLLFMAAVAIGTVISVSQGRPSPLLIGVFTIDSIAIIVVAVMLVRGHQAKR